MQYDIGEAANTLQTGGAVKIGKNGPDTFRSPDGTLRRIAQQGVDPVVAEQMGQGAASNITAADDQKFLHDGILPDSG